MDRCAYCGKYHEYSDFECLMTPGPSFGYELLESYMKSLTGPYSDVSGEGRVDVPEEPDNG